MGVELECKAVMADVVGAVAGFCHGTQGQQFQRPEFRLLLCLVQKGIQRLGDFLTVAGGTDRIAEVPGKIPER